MHLLRQELWSVKFKVGSIVHHVSVAVAALASITMDCVVPHNVASVVSPIHASCILDINASRADGTDRIHR